MTETLTCHGCGATITVADPITEDTMIQCDECGEEYIADARQRAINKVKKEAVAAVKGDVRKMLKDVVRKNKNLKLR